jgi:hypothetical protein
MPATSHADYIAKSRARLAFGLSADRINAAIESGEIRALYTGTRVVKLHREDCAKLLTTPPAKAAPTHPQPGA